MTKMEGRYTLGKSARLVERDALLSRLAGVEWPFDSLLGLLNLPAEADVLDVGIGDGRLLQALRARGHAGRHVGVDPEPGSPEVRVGVAHALPFSDGAFDVVTFVRVLRHLPDAGAALAEARRVVRPGGWVVLASHGGDHLRETRQALGHPPGGTGPEAALREAVVRAGWVALRLDARLPVTLRAEGAILPTPSPQDDAPQTGCLIHDTLHLALYAARF
ncbi:class I SAM-dependent methyltransferase [Deinococcus planocerae]|uniref:class I SAM-dependent methyltransferase n=1 Tax=Deinococcus planocerae TaxID=1737569 RepID=UPI001FE9E29D|nr:methyltransferase domain-containing protein [Deinococcus planocerae]